MAGQYWFATKEYGWGWFPVTWEGWTVTGLYVAVMIIGALYILPPGRKNQTKKRMPVFLSFVAILSLAFVGIAWLTGEPTEWRWGQNS